MKTRNHSPSVQQIFMQNKAYDNHIRKLSDIRQIRKKNLTYQSSLRNSQIKHIQIRKNNHFHSKFENKQQSLRKQNLQIYAKLQKVLSTPSRKRQMVSLKNSSFKKIQENRLLYSENKRIQNNINSSQSSIKRQKLRKEEKKRQQIRNRLRKYNDKSELKCKSYLKGNRSCRSESNEKSEKKPRISWFYNKTQILKNKVEVTPERQERPSTTSYRKRNKVSLKINSFFPTSQEL